MTGAADGCCASPYTGKFVRLTRPAARVYRITMHLHRLAAILAFALPAAAQAPLHLIPIPREVTRAADQPLPNGVSILCAGCDADDRFAASDLQQTLAARGLQTSADAGLHIVLQRLAQHPDPGFSAAMRPEGYTIAVAPGIVTLTGATASGVFYAAQTLKQMIETGSDGRPVLRGANIRDWPAMQYRGLHDDLSRGPVDTLEFQKKIVRTLAAYKDNLYSPYFENTQQYASNPLAATPDASVSAADARALVAYAVQFHITVVPEQEAFGHLRKMLIYDKYADLAETPHGAVLSPGQPGSLPLIDSMFKELAALYPSPFLHIGGDETIDLGIGRTRPAVESRGLAAVYLDFLQRIVADLQPLHRKILFWGDIAQDAPALVKALPQSFKDQTIAVAWGYTPNPKGFASAIKPFTDAGLQVWVSPSINNYRQVYPNQQQGLDDIQGFTRDGQRLGATGQLNTLWDDDGESLANMNWYGILFGCAAAWQHGDSSIPAFQQSFAQVFHGSSSDLLNQAQDELTAAMSLLHDSKVISSTEGTDTLFWVDPWSKDGLVFGNRMRPISSALRLHAEHAITLIDGARRAEPNLREGEALDAMDFGARRIDFLGLKFQLADEMAAGYARAQTTAASPEHRPRPSVASMLSDINGVNGRLQDVIDGYSQLRDMFGQQWLRTYRPGGLRPVLERYDFTVALWLSRVDKVRSAQRQWSETRTLLPASDLGIPPPPPPAIPASTPPS